MVAYSNGRRSLKSWFGVCLGLIIFSILVIYAQMKLNILLDYQDVTIMEPILRNHYNDSYEFTSEMGL